MRQTLFENELAVTSGVPLSRLRPLLLIAGLGCTAPVTAIAGPIVFVAFAAP